MEDCSCSVTLGSVSEGLLETFAAVRSRCPALHQILVPDEVWPDFQQWHRQPADKVDFHQSILLLAMERGHLYRVTSAVHRYLITAGLPNFTGVARSIIGLCGGFLAMPGQGEYLRS